MTIIVDASVALKCVIEEDGSEAAGALLLKEPLAPPDLLMFECANVLWAKARRRVLTRDWPARPFQQSKRPQSSCCLPAARLPPPTR